VNDRQAPFPPGPNVGTQLRALRARKTRGDRKRGAEDGASDAAVARRRDTSAKAQLSLPSAEGWFAAHGWQPFEFQREVWQHIAEGRSGLLHATTGSGKTYAVWFALLNRALAGADAWVTGLRREQGPSRAATELVEVDTQRGANAIAKYNPLALWTERDLWTRIHERDLPYHPLHDAGYESIGCAPCTLPGSGREGRWAGLDKTECGLHVV